LSTKSQEPGSIVSKKTGKQVKDENRRKALETIKRLHSFARFLGLLTSALKFSCDKVLMEKDTKKGIVMIFGIMSVFMNGYIPHYTPVAKVLSDILVDLAREFLGKPETMQYTRLAYSCVVESMCVDEVCWKKNNNWNVSMCTIPDPEFPENMLPVSFDSIESIALTYFPTPALYKRVEKEFEDELDTRPGFLDSSLSRIFAAVDPSVFLLSADPADNEIFFETIAGVTGSKNTNNWDKIFILRHFCSLFCVNAIMGRKEFTERILNLIESLPPLAVYSEFRGFYFAGILMMNFPNNVDHILDFVFESDRKVTESKEADPNMSSDLLSKTIMGIPHGGVSLDAVIIILEKILSRLKDNMPKTFIIPSVSHLISCDSFVSELEQWNDAAIKRVNMLFDTLAFRGLKDQSMFEDDWNVALYFYKHIIAALKVQRTRAMWVFCSQMFVRHFVQTADDKSKDIVCKKLNDYFTKRVTPADRESMWQFVTGEDLDYLSRMFSCSGILNTFALTLIDIIDWNSFVKTNTTVLAEADRPEPVKRMCGNLMVSALRLIISIFIAGGTRLKEKIGAVFGFTPDYVETDDIQKIWKDVPYDLFCSVFSGRFIADKLEASAELMQASPNMYVLFATLSVIASILSRQKGGHATLFSLISETLNVNVLQIEDVEQEAFWRTSSQDIAGVIVNCILPPVNQAFTSQADKLVEVIPEFEEQRTAALASLLSFCEPVAPTIVKKKLVMQGLSSEQKESDKERAKRLSVAVAQLVKQSTPEMCLRFISASTNILHDPFVCIPFIEECISSLSTFVFQEQGSAKDGEELDEDMQEKQERAALELVVDKFKIPDMSVLEIVDACTATRSCLTFRVYAEKIRREGSPEDIATIIETITRFHPDKIRYFDILAVWGVLGDYLSDKDIKLGSKLKEVVKGVEEHLLNLGSSGSTARKFFDFSKKTGSRKGELNLRLAALCLYIDLQKTLLGRSDKSSKHKEEGKDKEKKEKKDKAIAGKIGDAVKHIQSLIEKNELQGKDEYAEFMDIFNSVESVILDHNRFIHMLEKSLFPMATHLFRL